MFSVGDSVIYSTYGVCKILEVGYAMPGITLADGREAPKYYVLEPQAARASKAYVPMTKADLMRPLLTLDEVLAIIDDSKDVATDDFTDNNQKNVETHFKQLLKQHDCRLAMMVAKTMSKRIADQTSRGKNPSTTLLRLREAAESQVESEFSIALGIPEGDVAAFIRQRLGQS